MDLSSPLSVLGNAYKLYAKRLDAMNIKSVEDILYYIPYRYEDYSVISDIATLQAGETVTVIGTVVTIKTDYVQKFKNIQRAKMKDATGEIDVIWFNQPYLTKMIRVGDCVAISGKVTKNANKLQFTAPEYELVGTKPNLIHTGRLVPMYHETKGVSSKFIRRQMYKIISELKENLKEYIPYSILQKHDLMKLNQSIEQIHFPDTINHAIRAKQRLAFDELFFSQMAAIDRKIKWKQKLIGQTFETEKFQKEIQTFIDKLPFELTNAQEKSVDHIFSDLEREEPMNRLLEGDVGSGKTVVAAIAMYAAFLNNKQSVLMAPTEILATQHFLTISKLLEPFGVTVQLQTGSKKGIKNQETGSKNQGKKHLKFDILIGTHAVLSKNINFDNLGLVVIDEQQRFGVEQRSIIRNKGTNPHFLTMTATPIPRTIALTMYGDLDLSLLDELPKGRMKIRTWLAPTVKRNNAYDWIRKQIKQTNSQVFIICPFIEESENMQTVKAATVEYERLVKHVFPDLRLGLLHGKMKSKEKDAMLADFKDKKYDILVATPVVEVGIDIPNATIIVIEAAERFGLSQLHQLRGRVGRGDKQSYCLLFTESGNPATITKLKALEHMHVGADLAEFDLQLRGPGDLYGTAQHGIPFFKIASFADVSLIEKARKEAENIFPDLENYPLLVEKLRKQSSREISPD